MDTDKQTLAQAIGWQDYPIASSMAYGAVNLRIGTVGSGGPVGVLVASVHGDEGPWGTIAINEFLRAVPASDLVGTLRVVPVAHPLATEANSRQTHLDGLDLNNTFPGDAEGTHTQRLAAAISRHALDGANAVIDIHGGGSWNVNCFAYRFPGSFELAEWVGTPLILNGIDRPTSLTGFARSQGATGVWVEMGGLGGSEEDRIATLSTGIQRALSRSGVLRGDTDNYRPGIVGGEIRPLCTERPGIYRPVLREVDLGAVVPKGTVIGHLLDPLSSEVVETYRAPFGHTALALLRPTIARIEGVGQVVALAADAGSAADTVAVTQ